MSRDIKSLGVQHALKRHTAISTTNEAHTILGNCLGVDSLYWVMESFGGVACQRIDLKEASFSMTTRLLVPGSDDNTWGDLLNQFLSVEHNADGTLKRPLAQSAAPAASPSTAATATLTASSTDLVDATAANITRTLPGALAASAGTVVGIKKVDSSTHTVTIIPAGADTIVTGGTQRVLSLTSEGVEFVSDGNSQWIARSNDIPSAALTSTYAKSINDRGTWTATTVYAKGDRYTDPSNVRRDVLSGYTSGASFGATDTANTSPTGVYGALATINTANTPHALGSASPGTGATGAMAADAVLPIPALTDLADQDTTGLADGTSPVWNATAGKFKQQAPGLAPLWQGITSGDITLPRLHQDDSGSYGSTPGTGVLHLTYFRAQNSASRGHISFPNRWHRSIEFHTCSRWTLYRQHLTGDVTLVASCANKTTFSGTYASQICTLTAAYSLVAGTIYAVGLLQVASTPASMLGNWYNGAFLGSAPLLARTKSGQADLPSSVAGSGLGTSQFPVYFELTA